MVQDAEKDRQELTLAHYLHQLPEDVSLCWKVGRFQAAAYHTT